MAKEKKKAKTSSSKISVTLRRFWAPFALTLIGVFLVLGIWQFMEHGRRDAALDRLPGKPDLSSKTELLRKEIIKRDQEIRQTLNSYGLSQQFGYRCGELGKLYQANHYYDHAVPCYQLAMEYDPKDPKWPYLLAFVHQERGETESVVPLLERAIDLAPRYSPAILKLGDNRFKSGKLELAKPYYERRLDLVPEDPYAYLGLARIALKESKWESSQDYLEKAIDSNPNFGAAHRLLAAVHEHFDRTNEKQQALDRAAKCTRFRPAPDPWIDALNDQCYDVEQLLVLGAKALTELNIEKALNFFTRSKDLNPENPKAHLALGRLWFMVSQREKAGEYFRKAIELDPKSDEAYFQLGLILRSEGKLRHAERMFLKALNFHPNNPNVHNNLGVTLLEQQKFRQAIKYLKQALESYPEHNNARYNLAMSLWGLGKIPEAVEQYKQILEMKPNWATAANSLAWILATGRNEDNRDGKEAIRWAMVACKGEGRKNPEYLDTLAAAYAEAGRFEQAVRTAKKSIELARSAGDENLAQEVEHRLGLYRSNKAFHE